MDLGQEGGNELSLRPGREEELDTGGSGDQISKRPERADEAVRVLALCDSPQFGHQRPLIRDHELAPFLVHQGIPTHPRPIPVRSLTGERAPKSEVVQGESRGIRPAKHQ